jgi:hypothetical protein
VTVDRHCAVFLYIQWWSHSPPYPSLRAVPLNISYLVSVLFITRLFLLSHRELDRAFMATLQVQVPTGRRISLVQENPSDPAYLHRDAGAGPRRLRKKFILCFDGTGNKFSGTDSDSNILKIFRMLDRDDSSQFHYYQPGIGTYVSSTSFSHTSKLERFKSW